MVVVVGGTTPAELACSAASVAPVSIMQPQTFGLYKELISSIVTGGERFI